MKWFDGLRFSAVICFWGLAVAGACLLPWVWFRYESKSLERVDYGRNEALMSTIEVCRRKLGGLEKFWCYEVEGGWIFFRGALFLMFSLFWVCYFRFSKLMVICLIALQTVLYSVIETVFLLGSTPDHARWYRWSMIVGAAVPVWILCFQLGSEFARVAIQWQIISFLGNMFIQSFDWMKDHVHTMTLLLIVLPFFKLLIHVLCRSVAKPMFLNARHFGENVVRSWNAWFALLYPQIIFAFLSRTLVVNLETWGEYFIFTVINSLLEVASRYSPCMQDQLLKKFMGRKFYRKKRSIVLPVSGGRVKSIDMELLQIENSNRQWYAIIVMGDMVAEYIALFMNIGLLVLFQDAILMMPLPVFEQQPKPFTEPMPVNRWILQTAIQLVCELLLDWFCFSIEQGKFQLPVYEAWHFKPNLWKFCMLTSTSFVSTVFVLRFLLRDRKTQWCETIDICSCNPTAESLYGQYCAIGNETVFLL